MLLGDAGFDVLVAAGGRDALRIIETKSCQIVVTDWEMPDMDGIALCRSLRAYQGEGYIYVLVLTVRNGKDDIVSGFAAGADDFITKGCSTEEMLARIDVGRRIVGRDLSLRSENKTERRSAVTDSLTGARNRRYLMKYLPCEHERCRRYGHPLAVLAFDVDHFKRINDGHGHRAGDDVLQALVARASSVLRESCDWIARSGGEEFVVVLPETKLSGAIIVGDRIRRLISTSPIVTHAGPISVTVSVGATAVEVVEGTMQVATKDLLSAADRALYISKSRGRNRTTAACSVA
jgi:diguanylate cyclase (GGDEF)-like protein